MLPRPIVRCLVARPGAAGFPFDIELVDLEEAANRHALGWAVIGPDPIDEQALDAWVREATLSLPSGDDSDDAT